MDHDHSTHPVPETDIAIVGMAGHFPGAPDVDELWRRVERGEDCLVDITADEAIAAGAPARIVRSPGYVLRDGRIDGVAEFDHEFFGIGSRDAAVMDPQHRHFLECAWEALESAAHTPEGFAGAIGVFGGVGMDTYLLHNLLTNPDLVEQLGWFLLRHTSNDKDFLTTTLSYRLGLTGPSVNVQTACSTSLVAVHLAVQSLLSFECDLALAGGVTIEVPHAAGHEYREGEILSPSGRCRAFDATSEGTVLTSGAAVVALRRLGDALSDGDPVLAVVKGSAVNNDGDRKVGYLAPSVDGHADVVKEALAVAGVDARTITLLEAHGTGTAVGDPIEVAALTEAFRTATDDRAFCRLVSTKPNIGHLDTAAGTASLVKVVQAMRHRTLPPLANHTGPNPLLDLDRTPFTLSGTAAPWDVDGPRRAGVSSLGVGGTNAHVIVEEAPELPTTPPALRGQVLVVSGRSRAAVDESCEQLATALERDPSLNLADVAHTLASGRRAMPVRRVVAVTDVESAPAELRSGDRRRRPTAEAPEEEPRVGFTFPGGGSQYAGMGAALDDRFEVFHEVRREGAAIARRLGGVDLDPLFRLDVDPAALQQPTASLPAVFVTSVALARQWMAWGVEPDVMIGHSLGEYAAAHLADVLSFEDALSLVITRSALMERASGTDASMLVIPLAESDVDGLLDDRVSLATVNADDECVVAGPADAVDDLVARLAEQGVDATRIPLVAAAHSSMLDPVLDEFKAAVETIRLRPPQRRYVSNLSGDWITPEQATDPQYWVDHLRHTVRFADGLRTALGDEPTVLVELGPGQALSSYARRSGQVVGAISSLRHPDDDVDDTNHTLAAFAQLWMYGVDVDVDRFSGSGRRRLRLPTYPFQRQHCWIEPGDGSAIGRDAAADELARFETVDDMVWRPSWVAAEPPSPLAVGTWWVVGNGGAAEIADELRRRGCTVHTVSRADEIEEADDETIDAVDGIVLVGVDATGYAAATDRWLDDGATAARVLGRRAKPARLVAVTRGALGVDRPAADPAGAMALGVVRVAPREYPDLTTALVDLDPTTPVDPGAIVDDVGAAVDVVAHRGGRRLAPRLGHEHAEQAPDAGFRNGGAYLVTGGLGGVGAELAAHLATNHDAKLVVLASEPVPEGADRVHFLERHHFDHPTCRRIRQLARLESMATKVQVVAGDLTDPDQLRRALDDAERLVGPLDGAIHAAGRLRDRLLETATPDDLRTVTDAKAGSALVLADELERRGVELLVLVSSTSTHLAPEGQTSYVAANAVLDAMAGRRGRLRVATLGFGMWADAGMAAEAARRAHLGLAEGDPLDHPVLGDLAHDPRGGWVASGRLSTDHHWVVDEHRSADGAAVLPGTAHLELLLAAARATGAAETVLGDVVLLAPLVVPDDRAVSVRVVVRPDETGRAASIRLESDEGHGSAWTTHSEAELQRPGESLGRLDVEETFRRCALEGDDPMTAARPHLQLGSRWDAATDVGLGDREAIARLELDRTVAGDADRWLAHPSLVDLATGLGVLLASPDHDGHLHVPVGYGRVAVDGALPDHCVVHARRGDLTSDELLVADLTIATPGGEVVARVDGLQLRPLLGGLAIDPPAPAPQPEHTGHHGLLDMVERVGLRPDEGVALLDLLVGAIDDHLVVSPVDLDALARLRHEDDGGADEGDGATGAAATGTTIEDRLRAMWSEMLGIDDVGLDDDFFDLGGHSLIAIRLMSRITRDLGVRFQLATIFEAPTVAALAALVRAERPELDQHDDAGEPAGVATGADAARPRSDRHLVTIGDRGEGSPFYVVHGAGGNVLFLWSLARALGGERPILGFQAHGIDGDELPDATIEAMAARYVAELRDHGPGPYLLGGYSGGGIVTLEMVRQLQALGDEVAHVVLFDSVPPGCAEPPASTSWRRVARNAIRSGPRSVRNYVRHELLRMVRRVIPRSPVGHLSHETEDRALGYRDVDAHGFVNLYYYFSATAEKYELGRYAVDVTILKADLVWPSQPADYHWTRHIDGELSWRSIPGHHHSMFYPENAPRLAQTVSEVLLAADPAGDDG